MAQDRSKEKYAAPVFPRDFRFPYTNWLAAQQQTVGPNATANWLVDLDADDLELFVTTENALMLVDRSPMITENGAAQLRKGVNGLGGTCWDLVGEVERVNDRVMHGTYSGVLSGTAVLVDQYVQLNNDVPLALVREIARANSSLPSLSSDHEELLSTLLIGPVEEQLQAVTRNLISACSPVAELLMQLGHDLCIQPQCLGHGVDARCCSVLAGARFDLREQVEEPLRAHVVHLWPQDMCRIRQTIRITGFQALPQALEKVRCGIHIQGDVLLHPLAIAFAEAFQVR